MKRGKLTPQQWRQLIEKYEASGMEQKAFAKNAGISWSAMQYWLYKGRRERGEGKRNYKRPSAAEKPLSFVEVKAPAAQSP